MRPAMMPTFLEPWTTLRGTKTMLPGARFGCLIADGHLIDALDDEQDLFLFEMDMVGEPSPGLCHPTMSEVSPPVAVLLPDLGNSSASGL
jgi:hypothetical protein